MTPNDVNEGQRQLQILDALTRLRAVMERSLAKSLPDLDETARKFVAINLMVDIVEDNQLLLHIKTDRGPEQPPDIEWVPGVAGQVSARGHCLPEEADDGSR
jgi:hypothetical protein